MSSIYDSLKNIDRIAAQFRSVNITLDATMKTNMSIIQNLQSNIALQSAIMSSIVIDNHWATINSVSNVLKAQMQDLSTVHSEALRQYNMPALAGITASLAAFTQQTAIMQNSIPPSFVQVLPHIQNCLYDLQPTLEVLDAAPDSIKQVLEQEIQSIETLDDNSFDLADFLKNSSNEVKFFLIEFTESLPQKITKENIGYLLGAISFLLETTKSEEYKQLLENIGNHLCFLLFFMLFFVSNKD